MELTKLQFEDHASCEALASSIMSLPCLDRRERQMDCAPNEMLWLASNLPTCIYLLVEGRVEIRSIATSGKQTTLQLIQPGQMFGYLCFCSHRFEQMATEACALAPSRVLRTSGDEFAKAVRRNSMIATHLLEALCKKAADADARVSVLSIHDARKRVLTLLRQLAYARLQRSTDPAVRVLLHISQAELAALTCLTRTHVTTLMTRFRTEGLIKYSRGAAIQLNLSNLDVELST